MVRARVARIARAGAGFSLIVCMAAPVAADLTRAQRQELGFERGFELEGRQEYLEASRAYREVLALGFHCAAARRLARLDQDRQVGSAIETRDLYAQVVEGGCAEAEDYVRAAELGELLGEPRRWDYYARAFSLDPSHEKAARRHGGHLEKEGRHAEAIAVYRAHLRTTPGNAPFLYFIAATEARRGRCDEARQGLLAFLRQAEKLPELARTTRDDEAFSDCLPALEPLLRSLQRAEDLRLKAEESVRSAGPNRQAIAQLDEAVGLIPDYAILLRESALVFEGLGDAKKAIFLNEAYLELAPHGEAARRAREDNARLRREYLEER